MFAGIQFSTASEMASIHGAVYEWNSFDLLEDVIVEVNSTPPQSMLAKYGIYSFNLEPGDYLITASFYDGNDRAAYTEEEISIIGDGDYVMDLFLLPAYYDATFNDTEFSELNEIANLADANDRRTSLFSQSMIFALIFIALLSVGGYYFVKQRSVTSISEDESHDISHENFAPIMPEDKWQELPDDLKEVIDIIVKNDGRITQKELRTKVKHSEAKVSLMISDLESRGLVRKFKKGRGNVIILEESGDADDSNQNI